MKLAGNIDNHASSLLFVKDYNVRYIMFQLFIRLHLPTIITIIIVQRKQGVDKPQTSKLLIEFLLFSHLLFSTLYALSFSLQYIFVLLLYVTLKLLYYFYAELYIAC